MQDTALKGVCESSLIKCEQARVSAISLIAIWELNHFHEYSHTEDEEYGFAS
jgi:hypothetical protein